MTDNETRRRRRPKSKKEIREIVADKPFMVEVEATSWHGNEWGGNLSDAPNGTYVFCGPDPHTDRRFYGTITVTDKGIKVT